MRRNIVRYAVLAYVITLQRVSLRVKKRFPTWQHVVDSGKCILFFMPIANMYNYFLRPKIPLYSTNYRKNIKIKLTFTVRMKHFYSDCSISCLV